MSKTYYSSLEVTNPSNFVCLYITLSWWAHQRGSTESTHIFYWHLLQSAAVDRTPIGPHCSPLHNASAQLDSPTVYDTPVNPHCNQPLLQRCEGSPFPVELYRHCDCSISRTTVTVNSLGTAQLSPSIITTLILEKGHATLSDLTTKWPYYNSTAWNQ